MVEMTTMTEPISFVEHRVRVYKSSKQSVINSYKSYNYKRIKMFKEIIYFPYQNQTWIGGNYTECSKMLLTRWRTAAAATAEEMDAVVIIILSSSIGSSCLSSKVTRYGLQSSSTSVPDVSHMASMGTNISIVLGLLLSTLHLLA